MILSNILLSEYGSLSCAPSPVNRMMAQFAEDFRTSIDINLGVGYVNERTIPRELILHAMKEVLSQPDRYPVALNYGGSKGSQNLIDSIRRFIVGHGVGGLTGSVLDDKVIIIGPNGATSLLDGIANVIETGIVLTTDPMYYIYCNYLERAGFEIVAVPEDGDGIRTDLLDEKIRGLGDRRNSVRFFYIITVNNPSNTVLSNERREAVVRSADRLSREIGCTVPVFFDRAYENLVHDPEVPQLRSGFLYDERGLVYEIGTMSKILAPALRIGYMIGRDGPFMQAMIQKTNDAGFSAPLIAQEIASYLLDHHVADQIRAVNKGYRQKALRVKKRIDSELGDFLAGCSGGQAGFYYYLTLNTVETTERSPFFAFLSRITGDAVIDGPSGDRNPRIIYVPGEFCVHPRGDLVGIGRRQLRLSYGFEEVERIETAVSCMKEAVEYAENLEEGEK